jgi:hypothetical protein
MSHPTGLFDLYATRVGEITDEEFDELKTNGLTEMTRSGPWFKRITTGSDPKVKHLQIVCRFTAVEAGASSTDTPWLQRNENYSNVLIFSHNAKATNGLVIVKDKGVWKVEGKTYPWRTMQEFDLLLHINDGVLGLESLK